MNYATDENIVYNFLQISIGTERKLFVPLCWDINEVKHRNIAILVLTKIATVTFLTSITH